jgi:ferredoxin/flavodoxin---NADP+ reductase
MPGRKLHLVIEKKELSPSVFILRLERNGFLFEPGQYVFVNFPESRQVREYSIFNGVDDPYIELLIKEVSDGCMSKKLKNIPQGSELEIDGPFGFFTLNEKFYTIPPLLLIATGTGISPFHSFIRSNPSLKYLLLHGVRYGDESYRHVFSDRYIICTSRDNSGNFHGRVTDYQEDHPVSKDYWCYLSGNYGMIEDMTDILVRQGIPYEHILSEAHN